MSLDNRCGPLTLNSSIKELVHYTMQGLQMLSKEMEQQKQDQQSENLRAPRKGPSQSR